MFEDRFVLFTEKVAGVPKELAIGKRKERRVPLDEVVLLIVSIEVSDEVLGRAAAAAYWGSAVTQRRDQLPFRAPSANEWRTEHKVPGLSPKPRR